MPYTLNHYKSNLLHLKRSLKTLKSHKFFSAQMISLIPQIYFSTLKWPSHVILNSKWTAFRQSPHLLSNNVVPLQSIQIKSVWTQKCSHGVKWIFRLSITQVKSNLQQIRAFAFKYGLELSNHSGQIFFTSNDSTCSQICVRIFNHLAYFLFHSNECYSFKCALCTL